MQAIFMDENEERYSARTNPMDTIIYIRKISRYLEGKYTKRFEGRVVRI